MARKRKYERILTPEAVRRNGGVHPLCGDPDHSPQHKMKWFHSGDSPDGKWRRMCRPKRSSEEIAVDWFRTRLGQIPLPGQRTSERRYPLRPVQMKGGDPDQQHDPCVSTFDLEAIVARHQETTGAARKELAQRWSQFAGERLGVESAMRQLYRLEKREAEIPTLSLRRSDELLLSLGHKLGQSPLACLGSSWASAMAMSRASFEVSGEPTNSDKVARRARRILRFSMGYLCGVEGYDPLALLDAEKSPEGDPEALDEVEAEEVVAA